MTETTKKKPTRLRRNTVRDIVFTLRNSVMKFAATPNAPVVHLPGLAERLLWQKHHVHRQACPEELLVAINNDTVTFSGPSPSQWREAVVDKVLHNVCAELEKIGPLNKEEYEAKINEFLLGDRGHLVYFPTFCSIAVTDTAYHDPRMLADFLGRGPYFKNYVGTFEENFMDALYASKGLFIPPLREFLPTLEEEEQIRTLYESLMLRVAWAESLVADTVMLAEIRWVLNECRTAGQLIAVWPHARLLPELSALFTSEQKPSPMPKSLQVLSRAQWASRTRLWNARLVQAKLGV